jgi:hypothetical protein
MSQIVEAIDAELEAEDVHLDDLRTAVGRAEHRIEELRKLREQAASLNGGGAPAASAEPKPKPKGTRAKKPPKAKPQPAEHEPKLPTAAERDARGEAAKEDRRKVLGFVREHGEISYAQAAELLGVSIDTAKKRLVRIARNSELKLETGKRPEGAKHGRPPKVYRLEASAPADDDGAKTSVERRVVEAVRRHGPIDKGTLAFRANLSITDLGSVAAGLVRRGVLKSWEEDGVRLYGRGGVILDDERG